MDIKILVATHKKYWMPEDDVYCPILLGSTLRGEDWGYQRDDIGDNISVKQPNYSDISALYWGWKNLNVEYMGLCHYRRYFTGPSHKNHTQGHKADIFLRQDYETILKKYDMILATSFNFYPFTVREQYETCHNKYDLDMVEKIIEEKYPEYLWPFKMTMTQYELHGCNMFVMKKEIIDQYCEWLFSILFELEKRIDISAYNEYQARVFGYLAERLFNVWLNSKHFQHYDANIVLLGESYWDEQKKLPTKIKKCWDKIIK